MKIIIPQLNPTVGDITGNFRKVINIIEELNHQEKTKKQNQECSIIFFSEMFLTGYPLKDLIFESQIHLQLQDAYQKITEKVSKDIHLFLGTIDSSNFLYGEKFLNSVFYFNDHKIKKKINKTILANHDIFNEKRYFHNDQLKSYKDNIIEINRKKILITICEDLWHECEYDERKQEIPFLKQLDSNSFDFVVNIAASPFTINKKKQRQTLIEKFFQKNQKPLFYINQVGANDSLIFDGSSFAIDKEKVFQLKSFNEEIAFFEINNTENNQLIFSSLPAIKKNKENELKENLINTKNKITENKETENNIFFLQRKISLQNIYSALVLGIKDYFYKSNFQKAIIGLSGGIDSALVTALAVEALGSENLLCVAMPSDFNSKESLRDAEKLTENLKVQLEVIPIQTIYQNYLQSLEKNFSALPFGLAEENLQSRIRGTLLMAMSNKHNYLLLNTGNKSELAVGYCTLYGDMNGALAPIGDLYKSQVFQLSNWISKKFQGFIPDEILTKEPSAELRLDQRDSDSLPDYEILDEILYSLIEQKKTIDEITETKKFGREIILKVIDLIRKNEYKRFQSPPILKINEKSFGEGRMIPIVKSLNF